MKKIFLKKALRGFLFFLLLSLNAILIGQTQSYDNPDLVLHIAPEDSLDGFGYAKTFGYFNNDNYEDLVVLAPHFHDSIGQKIGKAYLYYGTISGIDSTSYLEIEGIESVSEDWDGLRVVTTGDYNNDGYDDLAIGTPYSQQYSGFYARGYAIVFKSNTDGSGLNLDEYIEFQGYTSDGCFAYKMKTGDVNGDNIEDLIISAFMEGNYHEGRIYIYYGGNDFDNVYDKVLQSTGGRSLIRCVRTGDINDDGFDDIIGWDWYNSMMINAQIHIWLGSDNITQLPTYSRSIPYKVIHCLGDLNDDSFEDIVISETLYQHPNPDQISPNLIVIKGASDFDINDDVEIVLEGHHSRVSAIRDVNNNSVNDIFVDICDSNNYATSYVFSGNESIYVDVSDTLFQFVDSDSTYGLSVYSVVPADMNGDNEYEYYAYSQMMPYKGCIFVYNNTSPLIANFTTSTTNSYVGESILFTDLSTGNPTTWEWDFDNDGIYDSFVQNPTHEYTEEGIYSVKLKISDSTFVDSLIKENLITVSYCPPASPDSVQIVINYPDATISWTAVDTTLCGSPITPDGYIVKYNETASEEDEDFYFLNYTTELSLVHTFVAQFSPQMFYRVIAFKDYNREQIEYLESLNNSREKFKWSEVKRNLESKK